jgi:CheY-like chemotaxis protein
VNVVVMTAFEDMDTAVGAMRAGAHDYLVKPLDLDRLELTLERAVRDRALRQRLGRMAEEEARPWSLQTLVGRTPAMIEIYKRIGALASTSTPVLIRGETGTGKEVIARAIHFNSVAAAEPFVAVNCTAVPEPLLESELFGHLRGAFTGAVSDRRGRFELAGRGTLFLDEIGDVSLAFQSKLLRVLQDRGSSGGRGARPEERGAGDCGNPRTDRSTDSRGTVPRRSLLPAPRGGDRGTAAAGAAGGHPAPRRPPARPDSHGGASRGTARHRSRAAKTGRVPVAGKCSRVGERARQGHCARLRYSDAEDSSDAQAEGGAVARFQTTAE